MPFVVAAFQLPPLAILGVGILLVILLITKCRLHPFFALLVTGIVVGMLSKSLPGEGSHWIKAVETPLTEMGGLAGKIAFVIALAAVVAAIDFTGGDCVRPVAAVDVNGRQLSEFGGQNSRQIDSVCSLAAVDSERCNGGSR